MSRKYREFSSVEVQEAFRPQMSVIEIKRALAEAAGKVLHGFVFVPCCRCGDAHRTVLFGVLARDGITLMTFTVCTACIKAMGLLPSEPGAEL